MSLKLFRRTVSLHAHSMLVNGWGDSEHFDKFCRANQICPVNMWNPRSGATENI